MRTSGQHDIAPGKIEEAVFPRIDDALGEDADYSAFIENSCALFEKGDVNGGIIHIKAIESPSQKMGPNILFDPNVGDESDSLLSEESKINEGGIDVAIMVGNDNRISFEAIVAFSLFLKEKKWPSEKTNKHEEDEPGDSFHKRKEKRQKRFSIPPRFTRG